MANQTDINGDPRYDVCDTPYYGLAHLSYEGETADGEPERIEGVIAILDSEDGYIAFCTDEAVAARIVAALDAFE